MDIRRQFAAEGMLRRTGGCATTAFAMTVGAAADPAVSLRIDLVQC